MTNHLWPSAANEHFHCLLASFQLQLSHFLRRPASIASSSITMPAPDFFISWCCNAFISSIFVISWKGGFHHYTSIMQKEHTFCRYNFTQFIQNCRNFFSVGVTYNVFGQKSSSVSGQWLIPLDCNPVISNVWQMMTWLILLTRKLSIIIIPNGTWLGDGISQCQQFCT